VPDLSTYAKAIAGGFTISAVGGYKHIFDCLRDGRTSHSGTYNGNAVNVAAALATVSTLSENNGVCFTRAHAHGAALREGIVASAARHGLAACTTGANTVFSVHLGMRSKPANYRDLVAGEDEELYEKFRAAMFERGVSLIPGRWYVGMAHGEPELATALAAVDASFAAITGGG